MPHKPFEERDVVGATPEQMREELDSYFAHVQQHDPKRLEFTLMVAGHGEENGGTHVCSMLSGPPKTLATVITELMDELVKRDSAFAVFFLAHFLRRMRGVDVEVINMSESDLDSTGGADVEAQVKDLLNKLRGGTPPDRSIH